MIKTFTFEISLASCDTADEIDAERVEKSWASFVTCVDKALETELIKTFTFEISEASCATALSKEELIEATVELVVVIAPFNEVTSDSSSAVIFAIVDDSAMTSTLSRLARLSKSVWRVATLPANAVKDGVTESVMCKSLTLIAPPTVRLEDREKPPSKLREIEPDMNIT